MAKFSPPAPRFIKARWFGGRQTPKTIVIHGTVSPCRDGVAVSTGFFFAQRPASGKTSAHYVVDPGAEVQCVGDHTVAFHCGHNQDSIGIELTDPQAGPGSRWSDGNHEAMLKRAAKLTAQLCLAYDIPIRRVTVADLRAGRHGICGHVDMSNAFHQSTHTDPGPDFRWSHFIALVQAAAADLRRPAPKPAKAKKTKTVPSLGYIHHSGRFDRAPEQLLNSILSQARMDRVDAIGITEVAAVARSQELLNGLAAEGWGYAHPPHAECGVAYDAGRLEVLHQVEVQVSDVKTFSTSGRPLKPFKVTFVVFREKASGITYLVTVGHTPSHVQHGKTWFNNNRARQHRDGLKNWNKQLRSMRAQWKPSGGTVISMDLNLDVAMGWVRTYLRTSFPGFALVQDNPFGDTHDSRTIDVVLLGSRLRPSAWFKGKHIEVIGAKDSDHKSIVTRLLRVVRG